MPEIEIDGKKYNEVQIAATSMEVRFSYKNSNDWKVDPKTGWIRSKEDNFDSWIKQLIADFKKGILPKVKLNDSLFVAVLV